MKVTRSLIRAATFVADVLSSVKLGPFLKKHGIKDKRYGQRLIEKLRKQHTLEPAPGRGRPPLYTTAQLAAAQEALVVPSCPYHSSAQLVHDLKEQQLLPAKARRRGFMPALGRHLAGQGLATGYGTRRRQQPLSNEDCRKRLAWCTKMRPKLTSATLGQWWFEDEKPHGVGGKARCELGCRHGLLLAADGSRGGPAVHEAGACVCGSNC
jgi:hypothetical protein